MDALELDDLEVLLVEKQLIHAKFINQGGLLLFITFAYERQTSEERKINMGEIAYASATIIGGEMDCFRRF